YPTCVLEPISGRSWISGASTVLHRAHFIWSARPSVTRWRTSRKAWREGQTTREICTAIYRPSADQSVRRPAQASAKPLPPAEGKLVHLSKDKHMVAIVAAGAIVHLWIDVVVSGIVIVGVLEGVAGLE